jgi:hypothetical protein
MLANLKFTSNAADMRTSSFSYVERERERERDIEGQHSWLTGCHPNLDSQRWNPLRAPLLGHSHSSGMVLTMK